MQDMKGRITVMQCWNMALYLVSNTCNFYLCPCTCSTFIHTATALHCECFCPPSGRRPSITSDLTIMWTSETHESLRRWSWLTEIQWRLCVTMYFSYLPCQIEDPTDSFQISEQHQSSPPVSNTSCGYRELTLLYCLVLSLPSNFEQREISGPSESDKSKQLYSESGNNSSSSSTSDDFNDFNDFND